MREVAAYLVCEALGWGLVPPTVLREGPTVWARSSSLSTPRRTPTFSPSRMMPTYASDLKRLAAFDVIANNADRKSGHCLVDRQGRLWAIDNALTFHAEPKLRTVIWDFAGQPAARRGAGRPASLAGQPGWKETPLGQALEQLLSTTEMAALSPSRAPVDSRPGASPSPGRARGPLAPGMISQ